LNVNEASPEKKVQEFISFLPVLGYDAGVQEPADADQEKLIKKLERD
jgi:hypothetical protein